ncbi:hypothetical protein GCM10020220_037990 [Nonomuraea rubra]
MPLIEDPPPSVRPPDRKMLRCPACGWGTVTSSRASGPRHNAGAAAGMRISGAWSGGPASSTSTLLPGSSLSRAARTQPALPAPTMT